MAEKEAKIRPETQKEDKYEIDDLSSEMGIDYSQLRDLLKVGKWKEADEETITLMLKASGREEKGYLTPESIKSFSCIDLRTIDTLWVKYSKGHFGFSVQKHLWESLGGQTGSYDEEIYDKFSATLGWKKLKNQNLVLVKGLKWLQWYELTFDLNAPQGHLPACPGKRGDRLYGDSTDMCVHARYKVVHLTLKLEECNINNWKSFG